MADVTLAPCCVDAMKKIQKCIELSDNAQKFPEIMKIFAKGAKGPAKVPVKLYVDLAKAVSAGGIKITNKRAIRAIAEQELGNTHTGPQADFWGGMAGL
ncbi:MAG: hypothetical protein KF887_15410 [Paracoccaceae bacterium]|nr:MAG: hypothetical protein KF887_15410 [Paracoccaceae bacterium]